MQSKEVEVINILGESQGTIAVVSALFAGFGYSLLQSVDSGERNTCLHCCWL